ncbi:hypothetical protein FRC03_008663 [Tulasnella sp. 419]|nr:hypothetical protein FRC02_000297 [Tulasnella sp. 418]KAG8968103.1 hypothetical protein FRC03_008663 [Tulasnella sp. 419]
MVCKALLIVLIAPLLIRALVTNRDTSLKPIPSKASIDFYRNGHSHGAGYQFPKRDGWQVVGTSDLPYKYTTRGSTTTDPSLARNSTMTHQSPRLKRREKTCKKTKKTKKAYSGKQNAIVEAAEAHMMKAYQPEEDNVVQTVGVLDDAVGSLQGIGDAEDVIITWYTGEDLQNPSCWPHPEWAPTDESFACALTLEGWTTRPDCFKFLELCNGPEKCIFVRVVDTCAGCKKGSKHVDLTKTAFSRLAHLDEGKLTVHMRIATDPDIWHEDLWGPRV